MPAQTNHREIEPGDADPTERGPDEMNLALAELIADAVLYEGYVLYPYRPTSVKNRQRWTFGGIYPPAWAREQTGDDRDCAVTQCLVRGGPETRIEVRARFLQLQERQAAELEAPLVMWPSEGEPEFRHVAALRVGDEVVHSWQESVEREIRVESVHLTELAAEPRRRCFPFDLPGRREIEPQADPSGLIPGLVIRRQEEIEGHVEIGVESVEAGLYRLTVRIDNTSPWAPDAPGRDEVLLRSLISAHAILEVHGGAFISLLDPPGECGAAAASCSTLGLYPVLVGEVGQCNMMLASPIILYDYPQIAPESAGDLYDGTEIDEILTLRILTLTDEEKAEARSTDERAGALIDRTEGLLPEQILRLHGAMRGVPPAGGESGAEQADGIDAWSGWGELENERLDLVCIDGVALCPGDRVRLRPSPGGDAMDLMLAGREATIESIEQDYEDRIYVAVTVDDDPGQDLGLQRQPGHRFFFSPHEVEPLSLDGAPLLSMEELRVWQEEGAA